MRIIHFKLPSAGPCLGVVHGDRIANVTVRHPALTSVVGAFRVARRAGRRLPDLLADLAPPDLADTDYRELLAADQVWTPVSEEPGTRLLISGTGLTHTGSVRERDAMHRSVTPAAAPSDSQRMFEMGLAGGRPVPEQRGTAPEWFYKGDGRSLRGPGEPLDVPPFAPDGGEEPELAAVYAIDERGTPWRLGFVQGNEWSDHVTEKLNYLYLAPSKLRVCAIGPELVTDHPFDEVRGSCRVLRDGRVIYDAGELLTGERAMCHSLANLEDHHFKFPQHRQPGDVHVHFLGTMKLSYGHRDWQYQSGDVIEISFAGMGEPLRNPVRRMQPDDRPVTVQSA
jgi:hypothetical protein